MSKLQEIFNNLSKDNHEQLMYAFQQDFEQVVECGNGLILGVNVVRNDIMIIESKNNWILGRLKEND